MADTITIPIVVKMRVSQSKQDYKLRMSGDVRVGLYVATAIEAVEGEHYLGPYDAIPQADDAVILETSGLVMEDDVTVHRIPYAETSNQAGGLTAVIAS